MIKAGIIGATGYAGAELARLLYGHKDVEVVWYGSKSYAGQEYADIYQNMYQLADVRCRDDNIEELSGLADVIFTATPQGYLSSVLTEAVLSRVKVIDLSADYRIRDVAVYEEWYKIKHKSPQLIPEAVYGLCELNREEIKKARLVANPGCYPTCSFLAVAPLLKEDLIEEDSIIIDAKSGTTGAGRGAKVDNLFCEVNENIKAYGVATHRHTPEIEQQLNAVSRRPVTVSFTPHLVPMMRGILVTAYASVKPGASADQIRAAYEKAYAEEFFVRTLKPGVCPQTKWVEGSNFVDVNAVLEERTGRVIMMGALDNLVKGAAGQAVQNMNLMFGLEEKEGLMSAPFFP